jgi:V8-like Glu-specific endopeptidase
MKRLMLSLFACSIAACGLEPGDEANDETVGTDEQSLIGGTTDTGDACVVGVFAHLPGATSGSICTGTIIGPHTVLTAAHCVSPASIGSGRQIDLLIGTTLSGAPRIATTSRTFNPAWNINNLGACHDEGILHTTQTLSPVCGRGALNTGASLRLVGYRSNTHSNTGSGTKRQVTVSIIGFNSVRVQDGNSNQQICHGDSGGPAFQGANVVGVTSFGNDRSSTSVCFGGGFHCRVDADAAFINANTN